MRAASPNFQRNYERYLRDLENIDFSSAQPILGCGVDNDEITAEAPFFRTRSRVSRFGVVDEQGRRPDYSTRVILLKYLLMCPRFNDADDPFPARTIILYERRARHFLDAECQVMLDGCLLELLKRGQNARIQR